LISVIIGGLVVVALVVGVLTWRYWLVTRPPLLLDQDTAPASAR